MWAMAQNSMGLFFRGKLFADPGKAYRQLAIGILVSTALIVVLAKAGVPLWLAAFLAGLGGGFAQPILFKNLRYR